MHDTKTRSWIKAFTWQMTGTVMTFFITWFVTDSIGIAGSVAGLVLLVDAVMYWLHERAWIKVKWGRE